MLIPFSSIVMWLVLTNVLSIVLWAWSYRTLPESSSKNAFLAFLAAYLLWSNPLLMVQLLDVGDPYIRFTSQLIHGGGIVFVALLGRFVISLADPSELKRIRFKLFMVNYAILFVAAFVGLIENGVERGSTGLAPIAGPLLPYFNVSMIAFGAYFLWVCGRAYRRNEGELLSSQLHAVFWSSLPAFAMLMVTNAIIPGLTNNYQATPAGALWLLIMFAGVAFILVKGPALHLDRDIRRLAKRLELRDESNLQAMQQLFHAVHAAENAPVDPFSRSIVFRSSDGTPQRGYLGRVPRSAGIHEASSPHASEVPSTILGAAPLLTAALNALLGLAKRAARSAKELT